MDRVLFGRCDTTLRIAWSGGAAAWRLVDQAAAAEEPVLIGLCALLETECVLRRRCKLAKTGVAGAFSLQDRQ